MENKSMEELVKIERQEYFKKWRAANKEKIKKHNATYWQKRVEKKIREVGKLQNEQ